MAQFFQVTTNEILSGVCKAIYDVFGSTLSIYKDKQEFLELPAVCTYCISNLQTMGRYDRFTNTYDIIINYFPDDSVIINDKRTEMFSQAEKIKEAVRYINLPAYTKDDKGQLVETTLPARCNEFTVEENEGFIQISGTYRVRTKIYIEETKMKQLDLDITNNQIGG